MKSTALLLALIFALGCSGPVDEDVTTDAMSADSADQAAEIVPTSRLIHLLNPNVAVWIKIADGDEIHEIQLKSSSLKPNSNVFNDKPTS